MTQRRGAGVLIAIALFKLVKATLLIALGVGAFSLILQGDTVRTMRHLLSELGVDPSHPLVIKGIAKVSGVGPRRLEEVGVGTFAYAIVFLVEGIGLLLRRHWAEYLTSIVTASFVPFEIYELVHEPTAFKVVGLAANVLIVVYLVLRLWRERREAKA
ncbi:MAG: DUF2127 domain-containing protein [Pseudomonadota bacterium]